MLFIAFFQLLSLIAGICAAAAMPDTAIATASSSAAKPSPSSNSPSDQIPEIIKQALAFDKSQWADGPVVSNPVYAAPPVESANYAPGTLIRTDEVANASQWVIPPGQTLSRIVYQSRNLNGTAVPASAFVLWPYSARSSPDGQQVVVWTHGTSGVTAEAAPSHYQNLWHNYLGPFSLAMQGYIVVAPDYAGLGVSKNAAGNNITHEYCAAPAQANDAVYALQAARKAFPQIGKRWVVMGHSEGGGAAWSVAQRQSKEPVEGYLGAVAISPVTDFTKNPEPVRSYIGAAMMFGIESVYPDFSISDVMTAEGLQRIELIRAVGGSTETILAILSGATLFKDDWLSNPHIKDWASRITNGGQEIAGPLLVLQGAADKLVNENVTTNAVLSTRQKYPHADLEYTLLPGLDHNPTISGSQSIWMDWIADRFAGKPTSASHTPKEEKVSRTVQGFQQEVSYYLSLITEFYQGP